MCDYCTDCSDGQKAHRLRSLVLQDPPLDLTSVCGSLQPLEHPDQVSP